MKRSNVKKAFATLTITSLALAASLTYSLMSGHSTSAKSAYSPSTISAAPAASSSAAMVAAQTNGITMPGTPLYALDTDNTIFVLWPGSTSFVRLVRVADAPVNGNLIGIDFRVADGSNNNLYALTDTGNIYTIGLTAATLGKATLVSTMSPVFPSGYQSLFDFNPVINAIRAIGSDDINYAVVNSGGNLNSTVVQTSLTYNTADVAKGTIPKVSAGSYTNNFNGATVTIFYALDHGRDTLVTIDPAAAGGSSATGGGVLRTIGNLVTPTGARVNISPTADIDIYTSPAGVNSLVGVSGRTFFTIDLGQATPSTALGTSKNVVVQGIPMNADLGGRLIDVAAAPVFYEAENGTQGGGNVVNSDNLGFTGTGFVNFADKVAGGNTTLQINQSGTRTLIFRYANGGTANRPCNITVNGTSVGTVAFAPTGSFTTYKTTTLPVNLGTAVGFRAVRITSTTAAGGPNLDSAAIQ
ncbi:MAG TPA: DUF4394 domain-containing protein [Blastocatellia bacterium]|nr:DUF4394 domain-containing protein [Blastocatellia bacterium]